MILSKEYENRFLDLFRGLSIDRIEKFYIGLILNDGNEVSGDSYSRIEYDASTISWYSTQETVDEISTGSSGKISNVANINWGTALENWGTIDTVRFFLSSTGQDYFCDHSITPMLIENGASVEILAKEFIITTRDV